MGTKPLSEVSDQFLITRSHALLKGCHLHGGNRLGLRPEISEAVHAALAEVKERGLSAQIKMPEILSGTDPLPDYPKGKLFRYLDSPHLENFLKGRISFRLASSLQEDAHEGRRDNEMGRSYHGPNGNVTISGTTYPSTNFTVTQPIGLDYHLLCLSAERSRKLARDFNKTGMSFVVINDAGLFLDLVEEAVREKYPKAYFMAGAVTYYDPLSQSSLITKVLDDIVKLKEINYFYQQEYRIALADTNCADMRMDISITPPDGLLEMGSYPD